MHSKMASTLIATVLMIVTWECLIVNAYYFLRRPTDGDCCRSYRFDGSVDEYFHRFFSKLRRYNSFPCRDGTVVNSAGQCVDPKSYDADRCQDTSDFTQYKVQQICWNRPKAIFADPFDCTSYYDCSAVNKHKRCPVDDSTGTQLIFHDLHKTCTLANDVLCNQRPMNYTITDLNFICSSKPSRVWAESENCNSFFNCSQINDPNFSLFPPYVAECPYLQLYDAETKSCRPYAEVNCQGRREVKNPCELRQNQCRTAHCRPCHIDNPDCTDKDDGQQPLDFEIYTPRYVNCFQGRTLGVGLCQTVTGRSGVVEPRLFHPKTKRCELATSVPRSLGGLGPD